MKKYIFAAITVFALSQFIGCAKSRSGDKSKSKVSQQQLCPTGQSMTSGGCATTSIINANFNGYYSEKGNTYSTGGDTLSLGSSWNSLLKNAMGVCDRCTNTSGAASCNSWASGFNDIVIKPINGSKNQVNVIIRSAPKMNGYTYYYWNSPDLEGFFLGMLGLPSGCYAGIQTPRMDLTSYVETYNSGKGFVVYGQFPYGSAWGRSSFKIYVTTGKLGDTYFSYNMQVIDKDGNQSGLASGRFTKCQSTTCGL